jgi:hypothetical protein
MSFSESLDSDGVFRLRDSFFHFWQVVFFFYLDADNSIQIVDVVSVDIHDIKYLVVNNKCCHIEQDASLRSE